MARTKREPAPKPVHFARAFLFSDQAVACGAETSWNRRLARKESLNLCRDFRPDVVTCGNCKRTRLWRETPPSEKGLDL